MTSESEAALRPCPFCNRQINDTSKKPCDYCAAMDLFGCLSYEADFWNNAYCWKKLDEAEAELEITKKNYLNYFNRCAQQAERIKRLEDTLKVIDKLGEVLRQTDLRNLTPHGFQVINGYWMEYESRKAALSENAPREEK